MEIIKNLIKERKKFMKKWLRRVAMGLVLMLLVQTVFVNSVYAKEDLINSVHSCEFVGTDGVTYLLELYGENIEDCTMVITNLETQDKKITAYNYGIVTSKECIYVGKKWNGEKKYSEKNKKVVDMREYIEEVENTVVTGQGYGTVVKTIFYTYEAADGKDYPYKYAVGNGSDSGYTQITCCKTYKIKNDNSNLINYKNAIAESNAAFSKSGVTIGVAAAVLALVAGGIVTGGASLAVAGLLATVYGISGSSIYYLIESYTWGEKVDAYYEAAKVAAV